jgi:predicted esterase
MRFVKYMLMLASVAAMGQSLKPGPQVSTFFSEIDDTDQPYGLYLPQDYNPARKYPLVISLHGAGSNHRLNLRRVFGKGNLPGESDPEATRYFPRLKDVDYIVASPLARGTMGYQNIPEQDVYDVLADVKRRFAVDENRVYLTGLSMGGGGALWIAMTHPDLWAAVAPVCPASPPGTIDLAPNALNLPMHFFHGSADPTVSPEVSRAWTARLKELGAKVEYTEYLNVRHNSWDNAYKDGAIFDWFAQFKRNPYPDEVRYLSSRYKYDRAYWVRIDELTPGTIASIDARFTAANRIAITTGRLSAFTLLLAGHPKYVAARPLQVTIDGKPVRVRGKTLSFTMRDGVWTNARYTAQSNSKHRGVEGPLADAIAARHLYVYGTADHPGEDDLKNRREIATKAAEWSSPRARLLVSFRVVADEEVKPSDFENANLILFGTKETNAIIARLADRLPMELNAGAADFGLTYIFPNAGHYVVVNSGLPWWTGAEFARRSGPRIPPPFSVLSGFQDYMLFKGSLENVIADGRFDASWRLPETDASKIQATGAVRIARERRQ